jgi:uncharacterized membrane protein YkvA (DUF1232 family)
MFPGMFRSAAIIARLSRFRKELVLLWTAFIAAGTPIHLRALILLVPLYLISPIDLIPDFIPFLGWLDDLIVVPFLVAWISRLIENWQAKQPAPVRAKRGPTIDGTSRQG